MTDRIGQQLGNYRLLRLLGQGGFAQVYLGTHLRMETKAAIKVLTSNLADEDVRQLLAEARIVACLEHPHIVRILDFDVERGIPFLVMSYAPHGTVRQRYPRGTRLPLDTVVVYLKQVADALQYAHEARLIHRDIKPENMLLGPRDEILLSDFGIATVAHSSRSQDAQEIAGTITYMAPEQTQGKARPASDQYAMGVIVYEWLSGTLPFGGTAGEIVTQHILASPPSLCEKVPTLPPTLEAVVFKALEKDPHRRFASMREFAMAFEEAYRASPLYVLNAPLLLPDQSSTTAPLTLIHSQTQPSPKRVRRRSLLVGALTLLGGAGVGAGVVGLLSSQNAMSGTESTNVVVYGEHAGSLKGVAWSPDNKRVISAGDFYDQTAQIWEAATGRRLLTYRGHHSDVNAVAWSPDGRYIVTCGGNVFLMNNEESNAQVWDSTTGTMLYRYKGHKATLLAVAWSPDSQRVASAGVDKTVHIWDLKGAKPMIYSGHSVVVRSVSWSSDGRRIASSGDEKSVQVWDAAEGKLLLSLPQPGLVNAVAWSPDNRFIASACGNFFWREKFVVQLQDAETGKRVLSYMGHKGQVNAVAWSPDSRRIASASNDKTIHIWDALTGQHQFTLRGHTHYVNTLAWSPDGRRIVSGSTDGTARVWQVP
jgi:serine/threonine protein kinase